MKAGILIELDALLDTRMGALAALDGSAAARILEAKKWATRLSDEPSYLDKAISDDLFKALYTTRNVDTLVVSRPTELFYQLRHVITDIELAMAHGSPEYSESFIDINYWPYELQADEQEMIAAALAMSCSSITPVRMVSIPLDQLSFEMITSNQWQAIFMYNARYWLETYWTYQLQHSLTPTRVPHVILYAPAITASIANVIKQSQATGNRSGGYDIFEGVKIMLSDYINFEAVPVGLFSLFGLEKEIGWRKASKPSKTSTDGSATSGTPESA